LRPGIVHLGADQLSLIFIHDRFRLQHLRLIGARVHQPQQIAVTDADIKGLRVVTRRPNPQ